MKYRISSGVVVLALAGLGLAALLHDSSVRSEEPKKKGTGTVREAGSGDISTRPPSTTAPAASGSLAQRSAASVGPIAKGASDVGATGAGFQGPDYNDAGELKRPTGYETWVFVGSNLGIEYGDAAAKEKPAEKDKTATKRPGKGANFHNVYLNREAYADYLKTGKFPEKTVLVLDIFKAEEREPRKIVAEGLFPGAHSGLAVAVKLLRLPPRTRRRRQCVGAVLSDAAGKVRREDKAHSFCHPACARRTTISEDRDYDMT